MSTVLVVNAGSSSIKYQLVDPSTGEVFAKGVVERIGAGDGILTHTVHGEKTTRTGDFADHGAALQAVLDVFDEVGPRLADAGIVTGRPVPTLDGRLLVVELGLALLVGRQEHRVAGQQVAAHARLRIEHLQQQGVEVMQARAARAHPCAAQCACACV